MAASDRGTDDDALPLDDRRPEGRLSKLGRERLHTDDTTVRIIVALVLATVIAVALAVTGMVFARSRRSDLWFEIAKAGIQLWVVAIVGGGVAAAFKHVESRRDDRRRLDEYRFGLFGELVEAYNRVKAVRRTLRAYGFRTPKAGTTLGPDQIGEFRRQMGSLVEAQLSLERIGREVRAQPQLFRPDGEHVERLIHDAESYVNDAIRDWERFGVEIVAGADAQDATSSLEHLQEFLASARVGQFKQRVSEPLEEVERLIQSQLLSGGGRSSSRMSRP